MDILMSRVTTLIKANNYAEALPVFEKLESMNVKLPESFDYSSIPGLSNELKQKLSEQRPDSIGRASRIPGVTPAAVSLLLVYLKKHQLVIASQQVADSLSKTA